MNRKYVYALVALPLLILVALLVLPGETRSTFISEFVHRTKLMFGFQPEPIVGADGEMGLRSERPEEYGLQPEAEDGETEAESNGAAGDRPAGGAPNAKSLFERRDEDSNGILEGEEIGERMKANLEAIDANGDGRVSLEELEKRFEQMSSNRSSEEAATSPTPE